MISTTQTNAPQALAQSVNERLWQFVGYPIDTTFTDTENTKTMKNYALMNRKTGKVTGRKFATRAAARIAKRDGGFKHSIYKLDTGTVIR